MSNPQPKNNKSSSRKRKEYSVSELAELNGFDLVRLVGCALLIFSFIDYLTILLPPQLFNPLWELTAMERLVDEVWFPLLGFAMVFSFRRVEKIDGKILKPLKYLSRLALPLAIFYLLLFPLSISTTMTLYNNLRTLSKDEIAKSENQVLALKQQIAVTKSPEQLLAFSQKVFPQDPLTKPESVETLKSRLTKKLDGLLDNATYNSQKELKTKIINLFKNSIKIGLGLLIGAASFFGVWNLTKWIRAIDKRRVTEVKGE
jgi:hypothetical protein